MGKKRGEREDGRKRRKEGGGAALGLGEGLTVGWGGGRREGVMVGMSICDG